MAFLPKSKSPLISWMQSPSTLILELKQIKFVTVSTFSSSICHEMMGLDGMILSQLFLCHLHQEALLFLFASCHWSGIICISQVVDMSPGNLDFSLCFIQPSISHDVLCI